MRSISQALLAGSALSFLCGAAFAQAPAAADNAAAAHEEVVVTASGFEQRITQAPASISVLPRTVIEENRGNSIAEILRNVEGVDVGATVDKTGASSINIRGMGSDYTLVLIDGRRQNAAGNVTPNGFGGTASIFMPPVAAIERIEVVRGPVSTLYGSDAMGGVVNIITRTPKDEWLGSAGLQGTIQFDDEFGDQTGGDLYLSGPLVSDVVGLSLRGLFRNREASEITYVEVDGDRVPLTGFNGRSATRSRQWQVGARLNFNIHEDHDLWFDASYGRQWYDNSAGQMGTNTVAGGYEDALEFTRAEYVLSHTWRLSFGALDTSLSRGATETRGRIVPPGVPNAGEARTLETTNTIFDTKLNVELDDHIFTVGGQYWDAEMIDAVASAPFEHRQWALFAEDEWALLENLSLTVGGRYDHHNVFGGHFSPRAYLVWNATDELTLKGGVSQGFKTPRLEQIASGVVGFGGQGTIPLLGSPGLKPETSTSYELGVYYDNEDWFRGNITAFFNQFDDKISSGAALNNCSYRRTQAQYDAGDFYSPADCYDAGFFPRSATFGQSVNVDKAETRGVETGVRVRFAEAWEVSVNYTFTESKQKSGVEAGYPLTDTPKHMLNGVIRWDATDDLSAWLRGEYRSRRFRGLGDARAALGDYDEQTIVSLGGSYAIAETIRLNASINNLLDEDFTGRRPYVTAGAIAYGDIYAVTEEPRRLWLSVNVDF